jgi:hypothetical protein
MFANIADQSIANKNIFIIRWQISYKRGINEMAGGIINKLDLEAPALIPII